MKIAVIIPCYKVSRFIESVVARIPLEVQHIICVDDACPENSGDYIEKFLKDPRIHLLRLPQNLGVGGAFKKGIEWCINANIDILIKIDGDGQMDPQLIGSFIAPILSGHASYTKGNRFYKLEYLRSMPAIRLFGNAGLSFLTKLSSGYWHLMDPTNGYLAIHKGCFLHLDLQKIHNRYFLESDLLHHAYLTDTKIKDIPMKAVYGDEESGLNIKKQVFVFFLLNIRNTFRRAFYTYFLRDFNLGSIYLVSSILFGAFGILFGGFQWWAHNQAGLPTPTGTIMLAALPTLLGAQLFIAFLGYDVLRIKLNE